MKNQEQFEQEMDQQSEIGPIQRLIGIKAKSAKWAFVAFPVAEQDNSICLVQVFWPGNSQVERP